MIHHRQVLATPLVGGGVGDTERGILFGIVGVPVRPDQDGVAVPAGREVPRTIDIESLLLVSVDRIGGVARQRPHHLVGRNLERARRLRVGRGPCLPAHATTHHSAPTATADPRGAGLTACARRSPGRAAPARAARRPAARAPAPAAGPGDRRAAGSRAAHAAARSAAAGRPSPACGRPTGRIPGCPAGRAAAGSTLRAPGRPAGRIAGRPAGRIPVVPPVELPLAPPCGLPAVPPVGLPVVPPSLPLPPVPEEPLPPEPHAAIEKARQIPAIDRRVCLMHIIHALYSPNLRNDPFLRRSQRAARTIQRQPWGDAGSWLANTPRRNRDPRRSPRRRPAPGPAFFVPQAASASTSRPNTDEDRCIRSSPGPAPGIAYRQRIAAALWLLASALVVRRRRGRRSRFAAFQRKIRPQDAKTPRCPACMAWQKCAAATVIGVRFSLLRASSRF